MSSLVQLCCMKVEVDMEKISAEIAAAEEAARRRMAEREKEVGDRGTREAPACVLAEEEKHVCATHGNKTQQNPAGDSGKDGDDVEVDSSGTGEEEMVPFIYPSIIIPPSAVIYLIFFFLTPGKQKSAEDLEVHAGSEEGVSEDKESVPEGAMEEGTSDSNTGSETTSAQTEDTATSEPSEGPGGRARVAH